MNASLQEIEINGIKYVQKTASVSPLSSAENNKQGLDCVIVRSQGAGVHFGYLKGKTGNQVSLVQSRRLWYWEGACSLSQLAVTGPKKPKTCRFALTVEKIEILNVLEILYVTKEAEEVILSVEAWKV